MNAIEVSHLRRVFKSHIGVIRRTTKEIVAVEDVSFGIQEGELFGLLGPNGAGKTTATKMLTTPPIHHLQFAPNVTLVRMGSEPESKTTVSLSGDCCFLNAVTNAVIRPHLDIFVLAP
jgi:ABC-type Na+ transport system ATPase subunit NatA